MIIDSAQIHIKAGDGGKGSTSNLFLSIRRIIGGGGDGGDGGDIIFEVTTHLYDLNKFKEKKKFVADDGRPGKDNNKRGANGEDLTIGVPQGTVVWTADGTFLVDLCHPEQRFVAAKGGKGGEGNYKKLYSLPLQEGEAKDVVLDFRVAADVAIAGFANSGKSTLANALTGRSFKVAEYPFSTVSCQWTRAVLGGKEMIILDTPPIKKQSHARGYTTGMLKQLTRPGVLIFVSEHQDACLEEFAEFAYEIRQVDEDILKDKKILHVVSKIDQCAKVSVPKNVLPVSAHTGKGMKRLIQKIIQGISEGQAEVYEKNRC